MVDFSDVRRLVRDNASALTTGGSILTVAGFAIAGIVSWPVGIPIAILGFTAAGAGATQGGNFSLESIGLASAEPSASPTGTQLANAQAASPERHAAVITQPEIIAPATPKVAPADLPSRGA